MQFVSRSSAKNWLAGESMVIALQQILATYQRDVWFQGSREKLIGRICR